MSEKFQLQQLQEYLHALFAESLFAIYLYGSAVDGGLGPESDLDLLVVVTQSLTHAQRQQLAQALLTLSHPIGGLQRALEVTVLLKEEVISGRYPLSYELQFGEWLREELVDGGELSAQNDPDISILLTKAHMHHRTLFGPDLTSWSDEIPDQQLWQAMADLYPSIVAHWDEDGDERNQILALCRIYFSLSLGEIVSKSHAAQWVIAQLEEKDQPVLQRMVQEYKGEMTKQDWPSQHQILQPIVDFLSQHVETLFDKKGLKIKQ